jgi:DNA-binding CsgD family transcriptional regulator
VVRWLTAGFSRADIARQLGLSEETVKTHLSRIYRKLGVTGRFAVAALTASEDADEGPCGERPGLAITPTPGKP